MIGKPKDQEVPVEEKKEVFAAVPDVIKPVSVGIAALFDEPFQEAPQVVPTLAAYGYCLVICYLFLAT